MEMERTLGTEGIAEDGRVGQTCQRCIGDWYLTILQSASDAVAQFTSKSRTMQWDKAAVSEDAK